MHKLFFIPLLLLMISVKGQEKLYKLVEARKIILMTHCHKMQTMGKYIRCVGPNQFELNADKWEMYKAMGYDSSFILGWKMGLDYVPVDDSAKIEIRTLRLLNDSLQKKLDMLTEFHDYACSILQCLDVVRSPGRKYVRFIDRTALIAAIERYHERYKIK